MAKLPKNAPASNLQTPDQLMADVLLRIIRGSDELLAKSPFPHELESPRSDTYRLFLCDLINQHVSASLFRKTILQLHGRDGQVIDFRKAVLSRKLREAVA